MFKSLFRGQPPLKYQLAWGAATFLAIIVVATLGNLAGVPERVLAYLALFTGLGWTFIACVFLAEKKK
jgi:hypothetical protein